MSRSLINVLGVIVTIGVLALGIFLVAMPIALQALGVVGQTATVLSTNATYQAQIDGLREEEENLDATQASVASLQTQITPANELDDVFELVATAAASSGVTLTNVAAGESAAFVERTSATAISDVAAAPPAAAPSSESTSGEPATTTDAAAQPVAQDTPSATAGRTQVDFTIGATAGDMNQVVAFLEALRAGPRLLGQVKSTVASDGSTFNITVSALTFVLPLEG
ncbi:hypothetical protein [Microbacterium sp. SS28]|uniref:hypothetical protein n=1 Tax=Microbacterium sp. SS28 TaxID=2919948 RepID=UPI001FAADBD5|nr:hypothetical protein [Microbacterium sp. SS28]